MPNGRTCFYHCRLGFPRTPRGYGLCAGHTCAVGREEAGLPYRVKSTPFPLGGGCRGISRTALGQVPSAWCRRMAASRFETRRRYCRGVLAMTADSKKKPATMLVTGSSKRGAGTRQPRQYTISRGSLTTPLDLARGDELGAVRLQRYLYDFGRRRGEHAISDTETDSANFCSWFRNFLHNPGFAASLYPAKLFALC